METSISWYQVFKGWYRKSLANKDMVWHRVHQVDSVLVGRQMAHTVCGRSIPTIKCDFHMTPGRKCMQCEKSPVVVTETGRGFVSIGSTGINTRADAIHEIKRLLKPRTYYLRIWGHQGVQITARWESDVSIDIYTETEIITKRRKNNVMGLSQVQTELGRFKSAVDCLCDSITVLAKKDKMKRKQKGRLTKEEDQEFFEGLLHEAEK